MGFIFLGGRDDPDGQTETVSYDTIEKLYIGDVDNIRSYSWTQIDGTLQFPLDSLETVIHNDYIFTIGGYYYGAPAPDINHNDTVDIINTKMGIDTVTPYEPLGILFGIDRAVAIVRDDTVYVFMNDFYVYHNISHITQSPTSTPSTSPTYEPTNEPTSTPSISPTNEPTLLPSIHPSVFPTQPPSVFPSVSPSRFPSQIPSTSPSTTPSSNPTMTPSQLPTASPENNMNVSHLPTTTTTTESSSDEGSFEAIVLKLNDTLAMIVGMAVAYVCMTICMTIVFCIRERTKSKPKESIVNMIPRGPIQSNGMHHVPQTSHGQQLHQITFDRNQLNTMINTTNQKQECEPSTQDYPDPDPDPDPDPEPESVNIRISNAKQSETEDDNDLVRAVVDAHRDLIATHNHLEMVSHSMIPVPSSSIVPESENPDPAQFTHDHENSIDFPIQSPPPMQHEQSASITVSVQSYGPNHLLDNAMNHQINVPRNRKRNRSGGSRSRVSRPSDPPRPRVRPPVPRKKKPRRKKQKSVADLQIQNKQKKQNSNKYRVGPGSLFTEAHEMIEAKVRARKKARQRHRRSRSHQRSRQRSQTQNRSHHGSIELDLRNYHEIRKFMNAKLPDRPPSPKVHKSNIKSWDDEDDSPLSREGSSRDVSYVTDDGLGRMHKYDDAHSMNDYYVDEDDLAYSDNYALPTARETRRSGYRGNISGYWE